MLPERSHPAPMSRHVGPGSTRLGDPPREPANCVSRWRYGLDGRAGRCPLPCPLVAEAATPASAARAGLPRVPGGWGRPSDARGSVLRVTSVLWLRRDLRRRDLPALGAAADAAGDGDVHVLFVIDPVLWDRCGPVRRGWLAASVRAAAESYDGRLTVRVGDPATKVAAFAADVGAGSVHVSAETTPYGAAPRRRGCAPRLEPSATSSGSRPARRTPSGRGGCGPSRAAPTACSRRSPAPGASTAGPTLRPRRAAYAWGRTRATSHAATRLDRALAECPVDLPTAGEDAALRRWRAFRDERLGDYADGRDRPDLRGTSQLSPYLKVGAIHPRTILAELAGDRSRAAKVFTDELAWREFYADVLHDDPASAWRDLRPELRSMTYDDQPELLRAWQEGRTGFPIVDAGHAPARRDRLDAQPGPDDHRQLPLQGPPRLVAGRRPPLPRPPRRRRRRQQQPRLAVGRRHRHRRVAVLPGLQPGHPGQEVRPRRRLRTPLGPRAGPSGRPAGRTSRGPSRTATSTATPSRSSTTARSGPRRCDATRRLAAECPEGARYPRRVRIWRSLDDVPGDLGRTAVVIGNFDGVHLGHQHVIAEARRLARRGGAARRRGDLRPAPDGGAAPRARAHHADRPRDAGRPAR